MWVPLSAPTSPSPFTSSFVLLWRRLSNAKNQMPYAAAAARAPSSLPQLDTCSAILPAAAIARPLARPRNVTVRCGGDALVSAMRPSRVLGAAEVGSAADAVRPH